MKASFTPSEADGPLRLAGDLDIYAVDELRDALLSRVRTASVVALDLSGVTACDPAAVQLLCAARRSAEAAGKPFHVEQFSEPVARTCAALGLASEALALS